MTAWEIHIGGSRLVFFTPPECGGVEQLNVIARMHKREVAGWGLWLKMVISGQGESLPSERAPLRN